MYVNGIGDEILKSLGLKTEAEIARQKADEQAALDLERSQQQAFIGATKAASAAVFMVPIVLAAGLAFLAFRKRK